MLIDVKKAEPFLWKHPSEVSLTNLNLLSSSRMLKCMILLWICQRSGFFCSDVIIAVLTTHFDLAYGPENAWSMDVIGKPIGALALAAMAVFRRIIDVHHTERWSTLYRSGFLSPSRFIDSKTPAKISALSGTSRVVDGRPIQLTMYVCWSVSPGRNGKTSWIV